MGGNAFKSLQCPRVPPDVYARVKTTATAALQTVFAHVTVPCEIPSKANYGDVDLLVSAPLEDCTDLTLTTFPFQPVIEAIKRALDTPHGRRGFLTPDCMYFAIPMPSTQTTFCLDASESGNGGADSWVQVDVKICFKPEMFSWMTFELNYASQSSILGSMIKPLGLTLDPEGLHIRVEEMEGTDWPGSMAWITRDSWMVCRVLGLGRRVVDGGFKNAEEIYEEYAGSWLFHPGHFKAKLEDESYLHYPDYNGHSDEDANLETWTARIRAATREKVFTMFPHLAAAYYAKRAQHVQEVEERRLKDLITAAIPTSTDGWRNNFELPHIIVRQPVTRETPTTPQIQPPILQHGDLTPPPSPVDPTPSLAVPHQHPHYTPLYIDALPRHPPRPCKLSPPPHTMSTAARLACLARWTAFNATGTPYLVSSPHAKDCVLHWRDAIAAGFSESGLVAWAEETWWIVWARQCVANWRGMWAKRFEKEDLKAAKAMVERDVRVEAEELIGKDRERILGRLEAVNRVLGLLGEQK